MNLILSDDLENRMDLLPLTFTRPAGDLRVGILTIQDKWKHLSGEQTSLLGDPYLRLKYTPIIEDDNFVVDSRLLPTAELLAEVAQLQKGEGITIDGYLIAARLDGDDTILFYNDRKSLTLNTKPHATISRINNTWDIFTLNEQEIERDFKLLTAGRKSAERQNLQSSTPPADTSISARTAR